MMRTKTFAIALTLPLLAGLAACGGGGDTDVANGPVGTTGEAQNGDSAGDTAGGEATAPKAEKPAAGGKGTLTMSDNKFSPTSLSVKPGQTVNIVNSGAIIHNLEDAKNKIKSGDVEPDAKASVKAPKKAGTYKFVCTYHAGMEGTFKVA